MAFSTQRDFMNYPPCISTDSAYSDDVGFGRPTPTSASYSTFLQDLTNLWNRLSGRLPAHIRPPVHIRPQGGEQRSNPIVLSSSESDSGINTESYQDPTTNQVVPTRHVETDLVNSRDLLDEVEDILVKLETEGKLTIEQIMNLIRKYQDYIKALLIDGQVPEGGLKKLLEYIESTIEDISKAIRNLGVSEQTKNILMEDMNSLSSSLKTYMCESKRESDVMYQELQKANFDRQSLQISLQKLSNVEGRIVDLKAQATKAHAMEKEITDLKDQLEKVQNNNHVLVQRLMQAKTNQNEEEEKHKFDCEKLKNEVKKWKCKAETMNELHQRDMLELEKLKVHYSRLSLELDKATDRVLRGHETKRKLYFAESMRCELEKQIEGMMAIIKQLSEQKATLTSSPAKPKECQNVLSNLLAESKNTLQCIVSNVRQDYNNNQSYLNDQSQQQIKKLREENVKLKNEIAKIAESPSETKKSYEEQKRKLQEELDKCRSRNNEYEYKREEMKTYLKQLEKCEEENFNLRKHLNTSTEASKNKRLSEENQSLKKEVEKLQDENSILKETMSTKSSSTSDQERSSSNQVIVINLQQSEQHTSNNYSHQTEKSDADHGDGGTQGIIIGPLTESSYITQSDGIDSLPLKTCQENCDQALDCLKFQEDSGECSCSGSDSSSSFLSYSTGTDTNFDVQQTGGHLAEVQAILRNKNERIQKLEKQCSSLQDSISKLNAEKKAQTVQIANLLKLEEELSAFKEELKEQGSLLQLAKDQLKVQKNDIKDGQKMLSSLQTMNNILLQENSRLHEEKSARDAIKREKDRHNGSLRNQENDHEKFEQELISARQLVDESRKQFNDKVRKILEEKTRLEAENTKLSRELESLDAIVDEVNAERCKNRKMEELLTELEKKIEGVQTRSSQKSSIPQSTEFHQIIDMLKQKLEEEAYENNTMRGEHDSMVKEIEGLKKSLALREKEIEEMRQMTKASNSRSINLIGNEMISRISGPSSVPPEQGYTDLVNELRTKLDSEKHRYYKLRTKFVAYSNKIEGLEEKLRAKKTDLEREIRSIPNLSLLVDQQEAESLDKFDNETSVPAERFKIEKNKNKKLTTKLIIEFIKNEKLSKELRENREKLIKMTKDCKNVEKIESVVRKCSEGNIGLQLLSAENGVADTGAVVMEEPSTMLQVTHDFPGIADQFKRELQVEREFSQKLQSQIDSDRQKVEQLKSRAKTLHSRNAQLHNAIEKREKSIIELQKTIDDLTSITTLDDKEVQTSARDSADYNGQLDAQLKMNFELTQNYNKEIVVTQSLRNELKQAQREIHKLCKCIEEVEKEKEMLKKQTEELRSKLESTKVASELKFGQLKVLTESSNQTSAKTKNMNNNPNLSNTDKKPKALGSRIKQICRKIQHAGIEGLDAKDLSCLHHEVYAAGKRLRISESETTHDKCWEFVTNLPPIPVNKEEKIMARVSYLETELDNANQVLQHLKKEYEKESRIDGREQRHRGGENMIMLPNNYVYEIPSYRQEYTHKF